MDRLHQALRARRLVIKVGSSLLVDAEGGVRQAWLDGLAQRRRAPARRASSRW